jgi:hypothetical protein
MDERRLKKIERILAIQQKMHRLAEWQLAALDRERQAVAENQERLVGALNADGPLHGVFVEAMARRLAALARPTGWRSRARRRAGGSPRPGSK